MKNNIKTIQEMLDTINNEASDKLNSWELSFMSGITDQFEKKRWLSEAQEEKLEKIYEEKI